MLGCRDTRSKAIRVVEIWFTRRMVYGPIGFASIDGFDHRRQAQPPFASVAEFRQHSVHFQPALTGSPVPVCLYVVDVAHSGAIIIETIRRPFHRRRKIEFAIARFVDESDKRFETAMLPKSVGAAGIAVEFGPDHIVQRSFDVKSHRQLASMAPAGIDRDAGNGDARKIGMRKKNQVGHGFPAGS